MMVPWTYQSAHPKRHIIIIIIIITIIIIIDIVKIV